MLIEYISFTPFINWIRFYFLADVLRISQKIVLEIHFLDIGVDPCKNHKFLEKADFRGTECHVYDVGSALCDRLPINKKEWFTAKRSGVILEMPLLCPDPYACGTSAPIWLNGNFL